MSDQATVSPNLYLYGIISSEAAVPQNLEGLQGQRVRTTSHGPVAVVFSEMDEVEALGTPEDLLAHTRVLDAVGASEPVLPLVFGTVVAGGTALDEDILQPRAAGYAAGLESIRGCTQYSLVVRFDRDVLLREIVEENAEAADLRGVIAGTSEDETRMQRMRLGEIVVHALETKQPAESAAVVSRIEEFAHEISIRETGQPEDVVELAALVQREQMESFERVVEELAEQLHPRITFRLIGPQAPYDFVPEV
ncbi:MAG TPA: GvpL/GvpF family gas vesicle protein [Candidatus Nesterenkonia stercoripullorum]|uniref:GvpL/GvpF family gas vesicle protein n=1 Tax=Candidatus Nesterenkonia stercoripullorum TaxID=2838701 RepID=A0A9D1UT51_9MICC|nr:GvpL/GvpF family gas vesicle protein [Candidatus Nesterenkonia stercoripullorum]